MRARKHASPEHSGEPDRPPERYLPRILTFRSLLVGTLASACVLIAVPAAATARTAAAASGAAGRVRRLEVPATARQLIVVSSPTDNPPAPGHLATLRPYQRASSSSPWHPVFGAWKAETGSGHLTVVRREGDHATPIGVFGIGLRMYGNAPNPGGLHYAYHRLACGDWWDEDPYSAQYNHFVHVPCDMRPSWAAWSEALWTETLAYPYFAVIKFNMDPVIGGADGPGSGIFLHSWVYGATEGCVALPEGELLRVLQWLKPSAHPVIEIGTNGQVDPA
jgi:L,D-peptidoglycan transpeptidase YkuD (ErfK/YbiS/YcfS/YnhG family)